MSQGEKLALTLSTGSEGLLLESLDATNKESSFQGGSRMNCILGNMPYIGSLR